MIKLSSPNPVTADDHADDDSKSRGHMEAALLATGCLSEARHKGRGFANALDTGLRWAVTSSPDYTLGPFSAVILQLVAASGTRSLLVSRWHPLITESLQVWGWLLFQWLRPEQCQVVLTLLSRSLCLPLTLKEDLWEKHGA